MDARGDDDVEEEVWEDCDFLAVWVVWGGSVCCCVLRCGPARRSNAAGDRSVSESCARSGCLQRWHTNSTALIVSPPLSGRFVDDGI